jgi:DNA-directed RNA polymerase specialized sigma24 family protein
VAGGEWGAWMAAAQAGDALLYRRLLMEVDLWLAQYYAARLPDGLAEAARRAALEAIHTKRHSYDPGTPFIVWLTAIAQHKGGR